jgi:acyl-CoA synthetase (NDP forming)
MAIEDWKTDLNSFFNPHSIAIIGASETQGSFTDNAYQYLIQFGFKGNIYPVNPKRDKVWNLPSFKTVRDIDALVDLVIVGISARMVSDTLNECGEKGITNAVILSSGFSEVGNQEGINLQNELITVAEKHKIRVCGPNCVGFASVKSKTVCYSVPLPPTIPEGRVGYVSQSSTMAANVISAGLNNIGFKYVVSSGNEAVLGCSDYIEFMLEDPDIDIVAIYLEGVKDSRRFLKVADLAAHLEKPFIVLKIGKSEKGREAAASHTGQLTGAHDVYQAVFKQSGIVSVDSIEQMVESIKLFSYRKPVKAGKLAIIGGSGGVCGYLSDRSEEVGLTIPDFMPTTEKQLRGLIPSYATVHNPLDFTGQSRTEPGMVSNICRAILEDSQIDILVMGFGLTRSILSPFIRPVAQQCVGIAREYPQKLLAFLSCNTESFTPELKEFSDTYQIPILQGGGIGLKALTNLLSYNDFLSNRKLIAKDALPVVASDVVKKWQNFVNNQKESLSEKVAKDLLKDYGIRVPKGAIVFTLEEAKKAASKIGYPVVLKIHSSKITHKTEAGGVKLNLADEAALVRAFSDLQNLAKKADTKEGFLLEEMIGLGVEVILGMQTDPIFGPVIMLGLGGIFTELFKDVTFRLPPFSSQQARAMIDEIRGAKLLFGFRGKPRCDIDALVDALSRIARLAQDLSGVVSQIDINPLLVLEEGMGVVALDALFIPVKSDPPPFERNRS